MDTFHAFVLEKQSHPSLAAHFLDSSQHTHRSTTTVCCQPGVKLQAERRFDPAPQQRIKAEVRWLQRRIMFNL